MTSDLFHIITSSEDFNNNINMQGVCVVDFFGVWCGPCTALAKSLSDESKHLTILSNARFIKVDVDEFPDLAELYNVSALPFLIFFKDGKLTENYVKGNDKNAVIKIVTELLA